ncbi:MAG: hypothetical protein RMH75_03765 [Archaeoglobaceae archaeon]|nr:hypothetical protein [Archaeoglobaceae archaeon]MDW7989770.1 hypothetical protein [Archaeoglobaceae archaeon]
MKLKLIAIAVVLLILGCVEEKSVYTFSAERNVVLDCQCHEEPWKYSKHYANVTSCKRCHGNEIITSHKNLIDWRWENVAEVACTLCHDPSLLANHGGKCETCHKSIEETHSKFLKKYIRHEVRS